MSPETMECCFLSDVYHTICYRVLADGKGNILNPEFLYIEQESDIRSIVSEALAANSALLSDKSLTQLQQSDTLAMLAFLAEKSNSWDKIAEKQRQRTDAVLQTFPAPKRDSLDALLERLWYEGIDFKESSSELLLFDLPAFTQRLIFSALDINDYDNSHSCEAVALTHDGDKYAIELLQRDYSDNRLHASRIVFEDFSIQNECYNYLDQAIGSHPNIAWSLAAAALEGIKLKHDLLGEAFLNPAEKELLPLADFYPIALFSGFASLDTTGAPIDCFSAIVTAAGSKKLKSLLSRIQSKESASLSKSLGIKLHQALQEADALPLWGHLQAKLREATGDYPSRDDDKLIAEASRQRIADKLHASGFAGEYPHFYRTGDIGGFRLRLVNGTPYLYTRDKNVLFIIDVMETRTGIYFVSGTILNKRINIEQTSETSAFEAFFEDGAYRIGRFLTLPAYELRAEGADADALLARAVEAAIKLSALERLTKEEMSALSVTSVGTASSLRVTVILALCIGIGFGLILCAGLAVLGFLAGVILGGSIGEGIGLIASMPWHWYFLFAAAGFGGIMAILAALARDK